MGLLIIKVPRSPLHPFPESPGHPKSMNKLTLNEPAITSDIELNVIMAYCKEVWIEHAKNTKWAEQLENANNFRL